MKKNTRVSIKQALCIIFILIVLVQVLPKNVQAAVVKQELKTEIEAFPESYQSYLQELKQLHPNWNFQAYYTGIDWNELIKNETGQVLHKRSVVPSSYDDVWKCDTCEDVNGWTCASEAAVKYFIDPRNFLDEIRIFQFEELSFNEKLHTLESIEKSVQGTFLKNSVTYYDEEAKKNVTKSYSQIILEAAKKNNISPFHVKAKIIQEVGSQGSASVSGTYEGYEGYYNFFNYGAHDTGDPIANGLAFAKEKGWDNPYKAIMGGVELIGTSYIHAGQNTSYFFKFDVVGDSILETGKTADVNTNSFYSHQYMTNIMDPYSQSSSVYNMYAANGNLDANLNFIIPVYENMPELNTRPTKFTKADGELYYSIKTSYAKDNPIQTSPTVYTMDKSEVVVMVSRKHIVSDDVSWDIVMLENGWNVYVESSSLKACEEEEVTDSNTQQQKVVIDEKNKIAKLSPTTTVATLTKTLQCTNYQILDGTGKVLDKNSEKVATGYKINVLASDNKTITKAYTLISVGDVNGDGKISASDYVLIKNYIMEDKALSEYGELAADVNEDGKISAADYVRIKNYIMEKTPINIK